MIAGLVRSSRWFSPFRGGRRGPEWVRMASEATARPVARTVVRQTCRVLLVYLSSTSCGPCCRGFVAWLDCTGLDGGLAVERRSAAVVPRCADLARQAVRVDLRLLRGSPVSGQFEVRRLIMTATPDAAGPDGAGWEIPADDVPDEEVDVLYLAGQRPPEEGRGCGSPPRRRGEGASSPPCSCRASGRWPAAGMCCSTSPPAGARVTWSSGRWSGCGCGRSQPAR